MEFRTARGALVGLGCDGAHGFGGNNGGGQPDELAWALGRIADQQLRVVLRAALACKVVGLPSAASDRGLRPRGGTPTPSRPGDRQGAVDGQ